MPKFLKSVPGMFPFSLVTYPLMVPVAIAHGVGLFLAVAGELIAIVFENIGPILMSPITVGKWALRNRGSIALFPFAAVKVTVDELGRTKNTKEEGFEGFLPTLSALYFFVLGSVAIVSDAHSHAGSFLASIPITSLPGHLSYAAQSGMLQPAHYVFAVLVFLCASNIFAGLFITGRAYYDYLTGPEKGQSEVPEAKLAAPQGHLTMFSKISDKDKVSEEEGWQLLEEAIQVGKSGKMKLGDMSHLVKMVSDRAPTAAVVR